MLLAKMLYAIGLLVGIPSGGWLVHENYHPEFHPASTAVARNCEHVVNAAGGMRFCADADLDPSGVIDGR